MTPAMTEVFIACPAPMAETLRGAILTATGKDFGAMGSALWVTAQGQRVTCAAFLMEQGATQALMGEAPGTVNGMPAEQAWLVDGIDDGFERPAQPCVVMVGVSAGMGLSLLGLSAVGPEL